MPIVIEQTCPVAAETAWQAITDHSRMIQWFFADIPDFKPEVGFETEFNVNCNGRDFLHLWRITAVDPGKSITYHWAYRDIAGAANVVFEVLGNDQSATVKLTNTVTEPFPADIPDFSREAGVAGWTYFIQGALKDYLTDGGDCGWSADQD